MTEPAGPAWLVNVPPTVSLTKEQSARFIHAARRACGNRDERTLVVNPLHGFIYFIAQYLGGFDTLFNSEEDIGRYVAGSSTALQIAAAAVIGERERVQYINMAKAKEEKEKKKDTTAQSIITNKDEDEDDKIEREFARASAAKSGDDEEELADDFASLRLRAQQEQYPGAAMETPVLTPEDIEAVRVGIQLISPKTEWLVAGFQHDLHLIPYWVLESIVKAFELEPDQLVFTLALADWPIASFLKWFDTHAKLLARLIVVFDMTTLVCFADLQRTLRYAEAEAAMINPVGLD